MNIFHKVTLKTLAKNRTRTIVAIVGIMLSTALITAVTTFTSSMQNCLLKNSVENYGDWYGTIHSIDENEIIELKNNKEITQIALNQNIGYSILSDSKNEYKPFLNIIGIDTTFEKSMPVKVTSGRMPENSSEIIMPNHLFNDGGIKYNLNETLELEIGQRMLEGKKLDQDNKYVTKEEDPENEEFVIQETRTYKVVGFYERPDFEIHSAPGYTAITTIDKSVSSAYNYNTYFKMNNPSDTSEFLNQYVSKKIITDYNSGVMRFLGATKNDRFNQVIIRILSIVIIVIMCGSILVIYNSFAISVSERTKQFGLLSSVGATKRQIARSVLFEALFVSIIGIPLGILVGIIGIGITLFCIKDRIMIMISGMFGTAIPLTLNVSLWAIIVAAVVALVTVLISAWLPSKRARRISAIEAIRQSSDFKIKYKKLKTHKWIYKVFGFEGALAQKNFKRNKKKYRVTVISLFMSIVLFITASSLCIYVLETSSGTLTTSNHQISYNYYENKDEGTEVGISLIDLTKKFSEIEGVKNVTSVYEADGNIMAPKELLSDRYISNHTEVSGLFHIGVVIYAVDDVSFEKYLQENNLSKEKYMNVDKPVLIAKSKIKTHDSKGKINNYKVFTDEQVKTMGNMYNLSGIGNIESKEIELNIGLFTDELVKGIDVVDQSAVTVLIPQCMIGTAFDRNIFPSRASIYISTDSHTSVCEKAKTILKENNRADYLYDSVKENEYNQNMIFIIQVFAYGFITIISLIAMANVFNTISTNILLRRREFAMLKSVGMTQRGFNKMMNFECILYGVKSLLLGLPVSIAITYYIYRSINGAYEMSFILPWKAIGIAVFSVFSVVFATMMYSMRKIKKDNPIDALKNENL